MLAMGRMRLRVSYVVLMSRNCLLGCFACTAGVLHEPVAH